MSFNTYQPIFSTGPLMWRMTKSTRQKSDLQEVQAVLLGTCYASYILRIHKDFHMNMR